MDLSIFKILGVLIFGFLSTLNIGNKTTTSTDSANISATPAGINLAINANNQVALDIYSKLKNENGNIFFSPYSISTALAMVYEGARGKTAEEIRSVFHFSADSNLRRPAFAAIYEDLNKPNSKFDLSAANALWAQNDYKFLNDYIATIEQYYAGKATNVDFKNATEKTRQTINKWIEDKTNNKIKDLFSQGSLDNTTRLVLTNAIYFKGTWIKQFEKNKTTNDNFWINTDNAIKVPMMQRTDKNSKFNYTETDDLQILEMPYEGNALSMMVFLPKKNNLSLLENSLTLDKINDYKNKLREQRVYVYMPKFTFDTKYSLNETLAKIGMPTAFTSNADFSGMDGTKQLLIQNVIHQAFIDVNEEGTEAAAATGISMSLGSAGGNEDPVFEANHPFIFIIQNKNNGNILFLGRVSNPSK